MKKWGFVVLLLSLAVPVFAGDKKYEDGKLLDIHMKQEEKTDMDYSNLTHPRRGATYTEDIPVFVVQFDGKVYQGPCSFTWGKVYHPEEYDIGGPAKIRFDKKRRNFWVRTNDDKHDSGMCTVEKITKAE